MNARQKYLARLYENFVDASLDVEAVRLYLATRGIPRTPAMVRDDLDNVFSFHGYAASHQPAPVITFAEIDRQLGKRPKSNK